MHHNTVRLGMRRGVRWACTQREQDLQPCRWSSWLCASSAEMCRQLLMAPAFKLLCARAQAAAYAAGALQARVQSLLT
jgi:hypothetical protein